MRVGGEPATAGAGRRDGERVAAAANVDGGEGRGSDLLILGRQLHAAMGHQLGPQLSPARLAVPGQQPAPGQPADVERQQPSQSQDVGGLPGLALEVEQGELVRQRRLVQDMVDAARVGVDPGAGLGRQPGKHVGHGPPGIDDADRVVDRKRDCAHHLAQAAVSDPAQNLHLAEPKMRVHHPEGDAEVVVVVRFDEGHGVVVPPDRARLLQQRAAQRQRAEPGGKIDRAGPRRPRRDQAEPCGEACDRKSGVPAHASAASFGGQGHVVRLGTKRDIAMLRCRG